MKNRMNVPKEYEPVLPNKVKNYLAEKETETEGQTIYYQCVDHQEFWAKDGHKSHKQDGATSLESLLTDDANEGALVVSYRDNKLFIIHNNAMLPATNHVRFEIDDEALKSLQEN